MKISKEAQKIIEQFKAKKYFDRRGTFNLTAIRRDEMKAVGEDDKHAFFDAFFGGDQSAKAVQEGNVEADSPLMAAARAYNAAVAAEHARVIQEMEDAAIAEKFAAGYRWETAAEVTARLEEVDRDPEGAFGGRGSNSPLADTRRRLVKGGEGE